MLEKDGPLQISELDKLLIDSGVTSKDIFGLNRAPEQPWTLRAIVYREIMWNSANKFSENQCEITHSEYFQIEEDSTKPSIVLCLSFFEKRLREFQDFLIKHPKLIPMELRQEFDMYLGYNYEREGGLKIDNESVTVITQEVYDNLPSHGSVGYVAKDHRKSLRFMKEVDDFVTKSLSES
jgi:hypothetical protein